MIRPTFVLLLLAAAGCGSLRDRADCRTSPDCPRGEYCAHTAQGSVCWPDAVPPAVANLTVACGTGVCVRDGALVVTADVTDDAEVLAVEATVDLDPAQPLERAPHRPVALARGAGNGWTGTVPLGALPFPALASEAIVTVRAIDGARNEATAVARLVVTRVRWAKALETSVVVPTAPAVDGTGTVVVGGSDGKLRFYSSAGASVHPSLTLAGGAIVQPPSIGAEAIWVAANDGKLYAVALDGSASIAARTCAVTGGGTAKGPPAILTTSGVDVAFGAYSSTQLVASTASTCAFSPIRDAYSSGAAIDLSGGVVGVTTKTGTATLRRFSWAGSAFEELWTASLGGAVSATPAVDALGRILTGGQDAGLDRTTEAGVSTALASVAGSIDESPIVLAGGDVVVGDASGKLHRIAPDGTAVWTTPADLGAAVHSPMALAGGPIRFLAATVDGKLHAIADDGKVLWSGALATGFALGAGAIHTRPGNPFSTVYFGGADGKLYAVVVEGALDTTAPWPKAWHDARNTSRAGGSF